MFSQNLCRLFCIIYVCCLLSPLIEASPIAAANHPDLYLRFRKNSNAQDNVQPFIRFRKSLPLRLRIMERQVPEYPQYPQYVQDDSFTV
uniref:Secreted protein n=1 Tax=Panagrolaimus sp. PS1159 TaxID=55785 RepID=A0AC35FVP6_9BILA